MELDNLGSLITIEGTNQAIGHLLFFEGKAYEPTYGALDVSEENANLHNLALDKAMVEGLDTCKVGESGAFYIARVGGKPVVKTFTGTTVSLDVVITTRSIIFTYNGMTFRGPRREGELFFFKREG